VPQRLSTTSFPFREGVRAADQEKQVFPLVALRAKKCYFTFLKLSLYYTEKKTQLLPRSKHFECASFVRYMCFKSRHNRVPMHHYTTAAALETSESRNNLRCYSMRPLLWPNPQTRPDSARCHPTKKERVATSPLIFICQADSCSSFQL
jgi:hypothetical protein